jgi:hypothetical protein
MRWFGVMTGAEVWLDWPEAFIGLSSRVRSVNAVVYFLFISCFGVGRWHGKCWRRGLMLLIAFILSYIILVFSLCWRGGYDWSDFWTDYGIELRVRLYADDMCGLRWRTPAHPSECGRNYQRRLGHAGEGGVAGGVMNTGSAEEERKELSSSRNSLLGCWWMQHMPSSSECLRG